MKSPPCGTSVVVERAYPGSHCSGHAELTLEPSSLIGLGGAVGSPGVPCGHRHNPAEGLRPDEYLGPQRRLTPPPTR